MRKSDPRDVPGGSSLGLAQFLSSNKPFIVVWLALFISIAGICMVSPLLPVFAEDMGASGIWLGLTFSGFAFSQVPLMPIVGRLSDRFGKKFFLWFGLLIYAMAAVGYFWSPSYRELVLFRVLSGVGAAMVIPTAFAYIGDLAPHGSEGRYMGLFNIAMIAGLGIGPMLGGFIHDSLGMDATFSSMAMLSILGFVIVFLFLPKRTSSPRVTPPPGITQSTEHSSSLASMLRDASIKGIVAFQLVYGLLLSTALTFLGVWMRMVMGTAVVQIGIVLSARFIVNGIFSYPFGWLADRMNRVIFPSVGMAMVAIGTFFIPWIGSFALLVVLFTVIGIFESMAIPSVNAIAVDKGRDMGMGSVMAMSNMAQSLGLVIGSIAGGLVESFMGIVAVFSCAAAFGFMGIVVFSVFILRSTRFSNQSLAEPQTSTLDSTFYE